MPTRANEFDAGLDLYALEDVTVRPGEVVRIETGIQIAMQSTQVGLYWDKSGRALSGLTILGGCIDGPYRGPLSVVVTNTNIHPTLRYLTLLASGSDGKVSKWEVEEAQRAAHEATIKVPYGKALTQIIVFDGPTFPVPEEVDRETWDREFAQTARGEKGFGSSDNAITIPGLTLGEPSQGGEFKGTVEHAGIDVYCIDGPCRGQKTAWPWKADSHRVNGFNYKRIDASPPSARFDDHTYNVNCIDGPAKDQSVLWPIGINQIQVDGSDYSLIPGSVPLAATYSEKPTSRMQVVEIIDGPHKGCSLAIVPKDVLYFKGQQYRRTSPDALSYRHSTLSSS